MIYKFISQSTERAEGGASESTCDVALNIIPGESIVLPISTLLLLFLYAIIIDYFFGNKLISLRCGI